MLVRVLFYRIFKLTKGLCALDIIMSIADITYVCLDMSVGNEFGNDYFKEPYSRIRRG
jgi:hypothetical protein